MLQTKKQNEAFKRLHRVYDSMPKTDGCMKFTSLPKEKGGCGAWCCKENNPSLFYSEFLLAWDNMLKNWSFEEIINVIEKSIENYVSSKIMKSCVFWDSETKHCRHHKVRPYTCRLYSIEPKREFEEKRIRLKVLYSDRFDANFKEQCNLVTLKNNRTVTESDTYRWWKELVKIEKNMGVNQKDIHDQIGGTFRTYHDHILLYLCSDELMAQLENMKLNATEMQKEILVKAFISKFTKELEVILHRIKSNVSQ